MIKNNLILKDKTNDKECKCMNKRYNEKYLEPEPELDFEL